MIQIFGQKEYENYIAAEGVWIDLTNPTPEEITKITHVLNLEYDDLIAAMDLNEKNRVEMSNNYILIIIDTPNKYSELDYKSIPLGIIITGNNIITVCFTENQILNKLHSNYEDKYAKTSKIEFVYDILMKTTIAYQVALLSINKTRENLEKNVQKITGEAELISLHKLESTLVHFFTSIKGNTTVITKMMKYKEVHNISDAQDVLDNLFIESQQNLEMVQIYREIISSTRELFSSIIDSRLNNVMKRLTSITVILSIPTIISGIYGMNLNPVGMPFSQIAHGFTIISGIIAMTCLILAVLLKTKKLL